MSKFSTWMQRHRRHLLIGGPLLLACGIIMTYIHERNTISTDDAYIVAANASINSQVGGQIASIAVVDNQFVKKGQTLFQVDARPYHIAVEHAKAELANAILSAHGLKTVYQEKVAETQAAQDTLHYQLKELNRQKRMTAAGLSSQMNLDKATNAFNNAKQALLVAQQQQANALTQLDDNANIAVNDLPLIEIAQANLHQAELNLAYTDVKAPMDGMVTKVDNLQVGDYISAGMPAFALIATQQPWVIANLKETQMSKIHPNQDAIIHLDAFPDKTFHGKILSISPGTGSAFAILPPENATGNWVKIVQRIPVKISLENPDHLLLSSGLSANVKIHVSESQETQDGE